MPDHGHRAPGRASGTLSVDSILSVVVLGLCTQMPPADGVLKGAQ